MESWHVFIMIKFTMEISNGDLKDLNNVENKTTNILL